MHLDPVYLLSLLNSTAEGIWAIDLDGRITFVNEAGMHMFGYTSREQMIGQSGHALVHHTHADGRPYPSCECPIYRTLQTGQAACLEDEVLWRADGSSFHADFRATPIMKDGRVTGTITTFVDTSHRRRIQDDLERHQGLLAATVNSISDAVIVTSIEEDPKVVFMNPVAEEWTGRSLTEVRGERVGRALTLLRRTTRHPLNPRDLDERGARASAFTEVILVSCGGREYVVEAHSSRMRDPSGRHSGNVLVLRDVSARAAAEEQARHFAEKDMRLRDALEKSLIGSWHVDLRTRRLEASPRAREISGWRCDEDNLDIAFARITHPLDRERVARVWNETVRQHRSYFDEFRIVGPGGETRWLQAYGRASYSPEGAGRFFTGILIDVTERKRLDEEQSRLLAIINNSSDFISLFDRSGKLLFINQAARSMVGLDARIEPAALTGEDFFFQEDLSAMKSEIHSNLLRAGRWSGEFRLRNFSSGASVPVHLTAFSIREPDSEETLGFAAITREIGAELERRRELVQARADAERANQLKSAFLANMSHEIRTPLGAILGFSGLLKDAHLSAVERDRYIDTISRNGQSLTKIIDDILDLAKVEAGKLDVEEIEFSFMDLISEVIDLFRERAKEKGLVLKLTVEAGVPDHVFSDPTRLRQIFFNIIGNAVKFTDRGSVGVHVQAQKTSEGLLRFAVQVQDTGRGLSADQKHRLFQPFTQADNTTTRQFGGTGLGLVLSRRLSEALGGEITIENCAPGVGCTFQITFAARPASHPQAQLTLSERRQALGEERFRLGDARILVVDDSRDNQYLVRRVLEKFGAEVETASDGIEAVEIAANQHFDAVLMDIQMPRMDGYQALEAMRRQGFEQPVIALTAHAMIEEQLRTRAAGFAAHLTKPLNRTDLARTLQEVLICERRNQAEPQRPLQLM